MRDWNTQLRSMLHRSTKPQLLLMIERIRIILSVENIIRFFGWSGVIIGVVAIVKKDIQLFLIWQLTANISGFLWNNYLQKKVSWDTITSLVVTIFAVVTKDQFAVYGAMLVRSVSYQLIFEQVVKQRNEQEKQR